mmetsp:Transcript_32500/g.74261  ORF Transcript_32500/g.74261 Transcript_32500/m.74261 type:complete len:307 (-) Transcript_32500:209-1129(-)
MSTPLADFMEATARRQMGAEVPQGYGYKADIELGVGFYREERTGVQVLEKPIVIPSGQPLYQGYMVLFAYGSKDAVLSILQGQLPPHLPASQKEPRAFASLEAIADNFGAQDPAKKKEHSSYCVPLRVPSDIVAQAQLADRDIWMVNFAADKVSPFLQAVKEGDLESVKTGLTGGMSANTVDEDGVSVLMMAAMGGHTDLCKALLAQSADPSVAEPINSRTPLMFAAQGGHQGVVEALLSAQADTTRQDSEGQTALMWAAVAGKALVAKLLAAQPGKDATNAQGLTAFAIAEKMGHSDTAVALKSA